MRRYLSFALVLLLPVAAVSAAEIAGYSPTSDNALPYSMRLGPGEKAARMLVVLDESRGAGKGYDVAVADLNLDGTLSDQEPILKPLSGSSSRYARYNMETVAPFGSVDLEATYSLILYVFPKKENQPARSPYVSATIKLKSGEDAWEYRLSGSPEADPESSGPTVVALGEPVALESTPRTNRGSIRTKVAIKDKNGLSMRGIKKNGKTVGPHLAILAPDGSTTAEKDMSYG
jgi:hypothetical protein